MNAAEAAYLRLVAHHLVGQQYATVLDAVRGMGALQAQDYASGLWSIGNRVSGVTLADVEAAIVDRQIVRCWPMRGTLHFVPAADARWMIELLGPRIIAADATRRRQLGLDDATCEAAFAIFRSALASGPQRRDVLMVALDDAGIATTDQRGYHLLAYAALRCLICLGPMDGKQQTFALFDQWITQHNKPTRSDAVAQLAERYFRSHGPASLKDFAGWTGLTMADAKAGLSAVQPLLKSTDINTTTVWYARELPTYPSASSYCLLPGFDELVLGYKDRSLLATPDQLGLVVPGGNGVFRPTIVKDGRILGTWKKTLTKSAVRITLTPFVSLSALDTEGIQAAAEAYAHFLGVDTASVLTA